MFSSRFRLSLRAKLVRQLKILQELQAKVQGSRNQSESGNRHRSGWEGATTTTTITFRPSDLWALLDSSLSRAAPVDSAAPNSVMSPDENDNSTTISLNVHVVPPWTEGQADSRQSTSNLIPGANGESPAAVNTTSEDLFHLGGAESFDPFLDDFFTPFSIGTSDRNWPLGLRSMPPAAQQDGNGWYR